MNLRQAVQAGKERAQRFPNPPGSAQVRPDRPADDDSSHITLLREAVPGYQILEELHRGGQGVVYRAIQIATN